MQIFPKNYSYFKSISLSIAFPSLIIEIIIKSLFSLLKTAFCNIPFLFLIEGNSIGVYFSRLKSNRKSRSS